MLSTSARDKALSQGVVALENAELLALLTVSSGKSEQERVAQMLTLLSKHNNSLRSLGMLSTQELAGEDGLNSSRALVMQAALELGRRLLEEERGKKVKIKDTADIYEYCRIRMGDGVREQCQVVLLDNKNQVMGMHVVSIGGITQTSVDVRVVLRYALLQGATQIVLVHNHPSGNPTPSREDETITQNLAEACKTMRIKLMDHVIIGDDTYYSFYENDKI
jgi:DNA repair protein RadC